MREASERLSQECHGRRNLRRDKPFMGSKSSLNSPNRVSFASLPTSISVNSLISVEKHGFMSFSTKKKEKHWKIAFANVKCRTAERIKISAQENSHLRHCKCFIVLKPFFQFSAIFLRTPRRFVLGFHKNFAHIKAQSQAISCRAVKIKSVGRSKPSKIRRRLSN